MAKRKDVTVDIQGRSITIPNVFMTVLLVGVTAVLFMFMDNPDTAALASAGFALVMMAAKALQVNYGDVLAVLGKDEDDLPDGVAPLMSPAPDGDGVGVHVKPQSKVKAILFR